MHVPGYYGADCSLSLAADGRPVLLAGTPYQTRRKRPHVYVYELPPHLTTWCDCSCTQHTAQLVDRVVWGRRLTAYFQDDMQHWL